MAGYMLRRYLGKMVYEDVKCFEGDQLEIAKELKAARAADPMGSYSVSHVVGSPSPLEDEREKAKYMKELAGSDKKLPQKRKRTPLRGV